jgi:CheY-like chemotaxis protein
MRHKKILLIEDDYLDVISVKRALSKLNIDHTLHVAHNGVDALSMLMGSANLQNSSEGKVQPDIILLDMNMPKMNGLEFLEIIKKYYSLKDIKVYIMTTSAEEYDKTAATRLGIAGYILKPLDFNKTSKDETGRAIANLRNDLFSGSELSFSESKDESTFKKMRQKLLDFLEGNSMINPTVIHIS